MITEDDIQTVRKIYLKAGLKRVHLPSALLSRVQRSFTLTKADIEKIHGQLDESDTVVVRRDHRGVRCWTMAHYRSLCKNTYNGSAKSLETRRRISAGVRAHHEAMRIHLARQVAQHKVA